MSSKKDPEETPPAPEEAVALNKIPPEAEEKQELTAEELMLQRGEDCQQAIAKILHHFRCEIVPVILEPETVGHSKMLLEAAVRIAPKP